MGLRSWTRMGSLLCIVWNYKRVWVFCVYQFFCYRLMVLLDLLHLWFISF